MTYVIGVDCVDLLETLPGRDEPLGIPGGPLKFGEAVGVDTPFVARFQRCDSEKPRPPS
ncbi:hypothetical protein [Nocardia sp. CC227C]|uniref:hypothetical protein n=1 Tax=Nocardia sp. CC227C TaxID=3044562 RepID=UPI00278C72ED|nr:hypothetical protein [Nocardia sp. CC227C]